MNVQTQMDHTMIEEFVASGDKLYCRQRERLQQEQQAYETERFALLQGYVERAQKLANEREDQLRQLDLRWAATKADHERMLTALSGLREG